MLHQGNPKSIGERDNKWKNIEVVRVRGAKLSYVASFTIHFQDVKRVEQGDCLHTVKHMWMHDDDFILCWKVFSIKYVVLT